MSWATEIELETMITGLTRQLEILTEALLSIGCGHLLPCDCIEEAEETAKQALKKIGVDYDKGREKTKR